MLHRRHAEVGGLDAQRGIVRHHRPCAPMRGLSERGADDAVVGHVRVEPVLDEEVLLDAVDLDPDRARRRPAPARRASRRAGRAAPRACAARRVPRDRRRRAASSSSSSSSTTVSGTTTSLSPNEWTHTGSAINTDVSSTSRVLVGVRSPFSLPFVGPLDGRRIAARLFGLDEIGHRHSSLRRLDLHRCIHPHRDHVVRGTPTARCCIPRPPVDGGWSGSTSGRAARRRYWASCRGIMSS